VATMISEVYDAFLAAGALEEKARKAAEAMSNYDQRFDKLDLEIVKVQAEQILLRWMVGFGIAMNIAILIRVFFR